MVSAAQTAFFTVFAILAVCFILAWPAYRIMSMWVMKELTAAEAVGAMCVLLAFLVGIVTTWGQPITILIWLLLITLAAVVWFGGKQYDRRRLNRFFQDDIAACRRALARDPDNAAAHMRLGDLHERQGDLEGAVEHFQEVVRVVPRDSEAKLRLASAIERRRRSTVGSLVCWKCGTENANTVAHCRGCGALISDRNQIVEWLTESAFGRAVPWLGFVCLLISIAGSLIRTVPLSVTVLSYLLLFFTVLCYVYPRWCRARD